MRRIFFGLAPLQFCPGAPQAQAFCPLDRTLTRYRKDCPSSRRGTEAQRAALTEANAFCAEKGRQFVPNNMGQAGSLNNPCGPTGYTVTFRCLLTNDPAVAKFKLEQSPNVIIERWLHNFGRCDKWNLCLTARTVVRANQERR